MSRADDDGLGSMSDDDLIEVQVTRASSTTSSHSRNVFENMLNPRGVAPRPRPVMGGGLSFPMPPAGGSRPAGGHSRRAAHQAAAAVDGPSQTSQIRLRPSHSASSLRRSAGRTPGPDSAFIDLTDEPDSPVERRRTQPETQQPLQQQPHNLAGRNPRRVNSQRTSPPQLARSDGTFMSPPPSFIDLTADSPEDEQRPFREHWRPGRAHSRQHRRQHHHHHGHDHIAQHPHHDHLVSLDLISHQQVLASEFARGFGRTFRTFAGLINDEIVRSSFGGDLQTMFPRAEPSPKPPMDPIPPARAGFTRDTCTTDSQSEQVVICPACNEELAYDPADAPATPSKKRKRTPGEHHFWALKKCGHVYCAECFENRRPTKSSPEGVGFHIPAGSKAGSPNDIRCAVEGCDTKVAAKNEWVGIFL